MSRKDYVAFAALLREQGETLTDPTQATDIAWRDLVDGVADIFQADNPNFNRERFIAAALGQES